MQARTGAAANVEDSVYGARVSNAYDENEAHAGRGQCEQRLQKSLVSAVFAGHIVEETHNAYTYYMSGRQSVQMDAPRTCFCCRLFRM